jgi:hypothetical protein
MERLQEGQLRDRGGYMVQDMERNEEIKFYGPGGVARSGLTIYN